LALFLLLCCGHPFGTVPAETSAPPAPTTGDTGVPIVTQPVSAPPLELCINEVAPSNLTSWQDETGATPDWIELHNPGAAPVDLFQWSLTDDRDDPARHRFLESLVVEAGGFVLFAADGLPELGPSHLSFSLAEEGEEVALFRLADASAEIVSYGGVLSDLVIARDTDCGPIDGWSHVFGGTPGASNAL
jgi:hypothetical protein